MVVIAAVDRDERADVVREADALATAMDESLSIVHVMDERRFRELERTSVEESQRTVEMDAVRDRAAEVAARAAEEGDADAEAVGLVGNPADEVVAYAAERDASYLVVGGRGQSPVGKALFGSTAQSVLLNAPCPVVLVTAADAA